MAQNYNGSLEPRPRAAASRCFGRFLPVGFYYKAFYKPTAPGSSGSRSSATQGRPRQGRPRGPSRLLRQAISVRRRGGDRRRARPASRRRSRRRRPAPRCMLIDENGRRSAARSAMPASTRAATRPASAARRAARRQVKAAGNIRVHGRRRLHRLVRRQLAAGRSAATGSTSCAPRRWWSRPARSSSRRCSATTTCPASCMGSAAQRLIRLYGVRPGRRAVVLTANDDGYGVALDLADAGVEVAAVVDLRAASAGDAAGRRPCAEARHRDPRPAMPCPRRCPPRQAPGHVAASGGARSPARAQLGGAADSSSATSSACRSATARPGSCCIMPARKFAYDAATPHVPAGELPAELYAAGSVNGSLRPRRGAGRGPRGPAGPAARACGPRGRRRAGRPPATRGAIGQTHPWPIFPHQRARISSISTRTCRSRTWSTASPTATTISSC